MTRLMALALIFFSALPAAADVSVEIFEGIPDKKTWKFETPKAAERYTESAFGFIEVPKKFNNKGLLTDRSNPFLLKATARLELPAGEYRFLLRARGAARLFVDDKLILESEFLQPNRDGHEAVPDAPAARQEGLYPLPIAHQEKFAAIELDGKEHIFRFET